MELYRIKTGKYEGRIGTIVKDSSQRTDNVMFYPIEGRFPYRVCVGFSDVEVIREECGK